MQDQAKKEWQLANTEIFWGEIAPTDHVVQIYESDNAFIEVLAGYVGGGINAGDAMVLVATEAHLQALENTLRSLGIRIDDLVAENRYNVFSAEQTLDKFMVKGWPDQQLFTKTITDILGQVKKPGRKIRVFGEMVALLWSKGLYAATVQLEHLWNKFCEQEDFCLFCAYPKSGFTLHPEDSLHNICCTHSKVINGSLSSMKEVYYQTA